jgi:hypothetical protein
VSNIDPKTPVSDAPLARTLRDLAHSAPQSAPPELGDSLLRAFHRHHRRRRVLRATSLCVCIVAVFAVCFLWIRMPSAPGPVAKQSMATTNTNPQPTGPPENSTEPGVVGTGVSARPAQHRLETALTPAFAKTGTTSSARKSSSVHHPQAASRAATAQNNPASQEVFVALPSFAFCAPDEELRVIRVNMPTSSLRLLGAPIDEDLATRRVTTDLLIGSDGTPYAVRLVM